MIKTFLTRQYNLDEDRIRKASENLEKFKKDLWYLSWALQAYDSDNDSVEIDKIQRNIKKRIEKINGENVFLPLSVFFRYEIPMERKFLEKQLDIKKSIIEDLIGLSEIIEIEEIRKPVMLSLHHSSIADLYFRTYQCYPSFGEEIKEKILNQRYEKGLEYCSFYRYLITTTDIDNIIYILIKLEGNEKGLKLIKKLIEEIKIQKIIEDGIKKEDIEKIGICIRIITKANRVFGLKLVNGIDINDFSSKIEEEVDIKKIGNCISYIAWVSEEVALKLAEKVSLKIDKEKDIVKIGWCLSNISLVNNKIALKIINTIDINIFSSKIETEVDLKTIGKCISYIAYVNEEVALKLVASASVGIDKENEIVKVMECITYITGASEEVANEIINRLNPKLREEIQKRMQ